MGYSVLIVEDESRIREIVSDYFEQEDWVVHEAENGKEAMNMLLSLTVDLIIVDILMPEMDGWSVCRQVRKRSAVPIIILTARSDDDDKLMGFELGADDYVTKPFSPKVLVARAAMLMKRVEGTVGMEHQLIKFGSISIFKQGRNIEVDGQQVELTPKEFDILMYMYKHKGIVVARETLLDHIWGYEYDGELRVVDTHIKKLRAKLGTGASHIRTVTGSGYKLEVKV
ncbi:response regulator transcription factor [Paenibacillus agilis]|uniref:Response regulator transcription factor n=1 Tax=Paenibacillus agilis TaxID=3020863 RepID=A0A559J1H8_9BACL|nr:response regulator transcription factor [Paenibacillus agilis]TVX93703.1 response regulator transcription factor [Paenibacillus agilis]